MKNLLLIFSFLLAGCLGAQNLQAQNAPEYSLAARGTSNSQRDARTLAREVRAAGNLYVGEFYPNPADTRAEVVYNLPEDGKIIVYNLLGSPVLQRKLDKDTRLVQLDIASLKEGVYFSTISIDNEKIATRRMVVRR